MKIAALADIHANLAALERVVADIDAWGPDAVMVAGDVVNRGPDPAACTGLILDRVARDGWQLIKGNHEEFVIDSAVQLEALEPWQAGLYHHSWWTRQQLGGLADDLASWPDEMCVEGPGGTKVVSVHASMHGNRSGLYRKMSDEELEAAMHPDADVLVVGHTHVPFVRRLGELLIVNVGAAGLPFDRDPRAAYGRLTFDGRWEAEIIRLDYDRARTERRFHRSGYLEEGGPMVPLVLDELRHARPRLRQWHVLYEQRVARGELSLEDSVREQLEQAP